MDYAKIYDNLILSRMTLKNDRIEIKKQKASYFEKHHIVPISMGGSNESNNIIYLTAREHFISHWLLWRIYRNRSMSLAFHKMMSVNKNQKRYYNSKGYAEARESFSLTQTGEGNPMFGKKISNEHKQKISIALKGKKRPGFGFFGDANPSKRHDVKLSISAALKGGKRKPLSEMRKKAISDRTLGENNPNYGNHKKHYIDVAIYEYDTNGNLIKCWNNLIEASNFYNLDKRCIGYCINKINYSNGSFWTSLDLGLIADIGLFYKKIIYEIENDKIINKWIKVEDLAKDLELTYSTTYRYLKDKKIINNRNIVQLTLNDRMMYFN